MAKIVFPSENAVGTINGSSTQILREHALTLYACANPSPLKCFVYSGFEVYANPGVNSVRVEYVSPNYNIAYINGSMISLDADINLTGLTNNTHFIYALLTRDGNLVTTWELVSNTTGVPPSYSVQLARVVVAGGVAGTPVNAKHSPGSCYGSYAGTSGSALSVYLGFRPSRVEIEWFETPYSNKIISYDPAFQMDEWQFSWDTSPPLLTVFINGYATAQALIYDYGFVVKSGSSATGHTYRYHAIA